MAARRKNGDEGGRRAAVVPVSFPRRRRNGKTGFCTGRFLAEGTRHGAFRSGASHRGVFPVCGYGRPGGVHEENGSLKTSRTEFVPVRRPCRAGKKTGAEGRREHSRMSQAAGEVSSCLTRYFSVQARRESLSERASVLFLRRGHMPFLPAGIRSRSTKAVRPPRPDAPQREYSLPGQMQKERGRTRQSIAAAEDAQRSIKQKGANDLRPFGNRTPGNNRYRCFLSDLAGLAARPPSGSLKSLSEEYPIRAERFCQVPPRKAPLPDGKREGKRNGGGGASGLFPGTCRGRNRPFFRLRPYFCGGAEPFHDEAAFFSGVFFMITVCKEKQKYSSSEKMKKEAEKCLPKPCLFYRRTAVPRWWNW